MSRLGVVSEVCYRLADPGVMGGVRPPERMVNVGRTLNAQMTEMARQVVQ
jgi:hypothetical protein